MLDDRYVGVVYAKKHGYTSHKEANWYRPSTKYPELEDVDNIARENEVYDAVREAFHFLKMDEEHFGTVDWNPLGEIIKPGQKVVLKPNLVMDYNRSNEGTDCLYTNPQVVAPIIDYILIALKGQGQIVVGDAPMQECIFEKLVEESGYSELIEYYEKKRNVNIQIVDFRELVTTITTKSRKGVRHQQIRPDAKGVIVNLGKDSEFYQYDADHIKNLRITNYSPDRLKSHHSGDLHEYFVSQWILDADVVINIPKPKTHRKAGFTAAMKNMVGINVRKEYLPHHTIGSIEEGGDAYLKKSALRRFDDKLYDMKNKSEGKNHYVAAMFLWFVAGVIKVLCQKIYGDEAEGNWYGNKTISKTIVDLNKILNYADSKGVMHKEKQRMVLNIGDMIISGEKEGPVAPSPKNVGAIAISTNAFAFDYAIGKMMGARIDEIPFIIDVRNGNSKYPLLPSEELEIVSNDAILDGKKISQVNNIWNFIPTAGWNKMFNAKK